MSAKVVIIDNDADRRAPTVKRFSPAAAPTGMASGADIVVDFSEALQPSVTLSPAAASASEGAAASVKLLTFTASLSAAPTQSVSVAYASAAGTACAGSDYTAATGNLMFAPGELRKRFTLAVLGDNLAEDNESFSVKLTDAVGSTLGEDGGAVITIVNDYAVAPQRLAGRIGLIGPPAGRPVHLVRVRHPRGAAPASSSYRVT